MSLMTKFEHGMERFLVPVANKLNSQRHIAAIRDAFILVFPLIMAGSIIIYLTLPFYLQMDLLLKFYS
ncbi:PTS system oligo-beta-mannoside-specific EIIC component [Listeria fleischmannii subsp. fleischmannii]|uniref:PTS system oligo-beta-mannoside-specific EIIC component n=1 Tax=Listeria fleischmannii subsp. fleischmannii TaxID=1671902 RepID=A0A2X3JC71_9LIST|nr:PTS system oligo-beta-mannoside-specific EIIC component [Listeria fleischmannii subsp. fleischmannii]